MLIKYGADVNQFRGRVGAPIHLAVENNRIDVVNVLLQNHADVNICSGSYMETPLQVAAEIGDVEILTVLLRHGAGVNTRVGHNMMTPLDAACWSCKLLCILQLLCFGAALDDGSFPRTKRVISKIQSLGESGMLYCVSERHFLYNLALCIALKCPGVSKSIFMHIRALITFRNMFMCRGFRLGKDSVWNISGVSILDCVFKE